MAIVIKKSFIVVEDKDGQEWGVEKESFLFEWLRTQPGGIKVLRDMSVKIEISEIKLRKLVEKAYKDGKDEVDIKL